ncbi:MAG: fibronectin type III domain-containing protein, partial [Mycobacterium sp.]|nr:fibronectin type III domain-containing protein [Mycobacterium sp.]
TNLHVVSATDSDILLAWDPATDNRHGYVIHEVFIDDDPDQYPASYDAPGGQYDVQFNRPAGLIPGSTHTFRIRAMDQSGNFTDSDTITGTFAPGDNTAPTVPTNLHVVSQDDNGIVLAWDPSVDENDVQYFLDGPPCSPRSYISGTSVGVGSLTTDPVCGISKGGTYSFSVRARDSWDNDSASSTPIEVTYTG